MKKIVCSFIVLMMMFGLLSCSYNDQSSDESVDLTEQNGLNLLNTMHSHPIDETLSILGVEYCEFVSENIIDQSYIKYYPQSCVTMDMIEYEAKYADIWKNEMENSVQNLAGILDEEDQNQLYALQKFWLACAEDTLAFKYSLLSEEAFGRLLFVDQRVAYKNSYRARTFEIKYIHYILEQQIGETNSSTALQFQFTEFE